MTDFDEGTDFEATDTGEEFVEDTGEDVESDEGDGVEDNPWGWADERGVTPDVVRDSFENYTKKTQELAAKEAQLYPYVELAETLQSDPALQQVLRDYYASGSTPEREIQNLTQELNGVKTQLAIENELVQLTAEIEQEGLPEFDTDELLQYAVDHEISNLRTSYRDMMFDRMRSVERDSLERDMKKSKGAALPKSGKSDGGAKTRPTAQDIANMSE
jgi:hypothetical protein